MPRRLLCLCCLVVAVGAIAAFGSSPDGKFAASRHHEQITGSALPLRDAVVLGVVEGATEYLPISSTGHLLIVQHLMGMGSNDEEAEAAKWAACSSSERYSRGSAKINEHCGQ